MPKCRADTLHGQRMRPLAALLESPPAYSCWQHHLCSGQVVSCCPVTRQPWRLHQYPVPLFLFADLRAHERTPGVAIGPTAPLADLHTQTVHIITRTAKDVACPASAAVAVLWPAASPSSTK